MALPRTLAAVRSRSLEIDYSWAGSPEAVAKAQGCANLGDNTNPTVVLQRASGDSWQLLVDGLVSGRKDRVQTPIRSAYFWEGLAETEARSLAARFLSRWDECANRLAGIVVEKREDAQRGWKCDWNAAATVLDQMLEDAQKEVTLLAVGTLPSRLQRPHGGVGSAQWQELAGELRKYSLPSYEAATLVVSSFPTSQATEKAKETAFRLYLQDVEPCDLDKKKEPPQKPSQPPISREPSKTPSGSSETSSAAEPIISKGALLITCAIVAILVTLIFGRDSNKKKVIERLGFVEVEPKALRLNIFFDKVSAEDLKQVLHVQTPETWSTKLLGWNADSRSFSLELTPIESKRTGTFSIAFPFPVEKRKLEVNLLPPWTAESEWGGEELILRVRSPDSDPK